MARIYTVVRAQEAPMKGGGSVWLTRANEHEIPNLLTAAAIRDRVKSGAFLEQDDGQPEPEAEEPEATRSATAKAGGKRETR